MKDVAVVIDVECETAGGVRRLGRCGVMISRRISEGDICSLYGGLLFVVFAFGLLPFDVKLSIVVGRLDSLGQVLFDDVVYCGFADSNFLGYVSV